MFGKILTTRLTDQATQPGRSLSHPDGYRNTGGNVRQRRDGASNARSDDQLSQRLHQSFDVPMHGEEWP